MIEHIAGETLAAYVDGTLEGKRRSEVEAHLSRCRECREALAEVVEMMAIREKAPREFLRRALEGNVVPAGKVLPLRPAFGIAAVFLVAVLIGYFYFGRGRVDTSRPDDKEMKGHTVPLDGGRYATKTGEAVPAYEEVTERAVQSLDEKLQKKETREGRSGAGSGLKTEKQLAVKEADPELLPAVPSQKKAVPVTVFAEEELLQTADKAAMNQPPAEEGGVIGGVVGQVEAPLEKDKAREKKLAASASAATQPTVSPIRAKGPAPNEMKQYRSQPPGAAAGAMQLFLAAMGRAAAPLAFRAETAPSQWLVRIEGDVAQDDLLDPKQLGDWEWLPAGLVLELEIAADGTVTVVTPLGDWDAVAVARATAAARKLTFSASARKTRRAVLSARNNPN